MTIIGKFKIKDSSKITGRGLVAIGDIFATEYHIPQHPDFEKA